MCVREDLILKASIIQTTTVFGLHVAASNMFACRLTKRFVLQVTAAGSPATTASGSLSDEEAGDEEGIGGDGVPKSKSRFKKFLKTFKMSTKTKDGKDPAPTAGHNSKALSTTLPKHFGTTLKC